MQDNAKQKSVATSLVQYYRINVKSSHLIWFAPGSFSVLVLHDLLVVIIQELQQLNRPAVVQFHVFFFFLLSFLFFLFFLMRPFSVPLLCVLRRLSSFLCSLCAKKKNSMVSVILLRKIFASFFRVSVFFFLSLHSMHLFGIVFFCALILHVSVFYVHDSFLLYMRSCV